MVSNFEFFIIGLCSKVTRLYTRFGRQFHFSDSNVSKFLNVNNFKRKYGTQKVSRMGSMHHQRIDDLTKKTQRRLTGIPGDSHCFEEVSKSKRFEDGYGGVLASV